MMFKSFFKSNITFNRYLIGSRSHFSQTSSSSKSNSNSFALSGCGWLTPFHFGVGKELKDAGYVNQNTIAAGTSGGALGALAIVSGLSPDDALEAMIEFGKMPQLHNNIELNMRGVLTNLLSGEDGKGTATLAQCNGRLIIVVTRLWPKTSIKPILVSKYDNLPFLVDIVGASCFIPLWSAPKLYTSVVTNSHSSSDDATNDPTEHLVDGGFLAFMPPIGDHRISPFPRELILSPRSKPEICLPRDAYSFPRLLSWVLRPAPEAVLRDLYQHGRQAGKKWIEKQEQKQMTQNQGKVRV